MKILEVHIYGYGKWEDKKWRFTDNSDLILFIGDNEAGKSTLMSFVCSVLFGFPKKGENQYIPIMTDKYGGSVTLWTEDHGTVTIRRVKGRKVKGDVTVFFPNGREGGEEALSMLLNGVDIHTFQGIFHFDLDGLNGLGNLSPEDMNQFLYDTGVGGAQQLTELEKRLSGEMETLFKPRGKKTEMNQLSKRLEEKNKEIKGWENRIAQFDEIKKEIAEKESQHIQWKDKQKEVTEQIHQVEKQELIVPLVREWKENHLWLSERDLITVFPENGLQRLEVLEEKLRDKRASLKDEELKHQLLEQELSRINPISEEWKGEVEQKLRQYDIYENSRLDWKHYYVDKEECKRKMSKLENQWKQFEDLHFSQIPFHSFMINRFQELRDLIHTYKHREQRVMEDLEKVQREVHNNKDSQGRVKEALLPQDDFERIKAGVATDSNHEVKTKQAILGERLANLKAQNIDRLKSTKQQQLIFSICIILFLGLAVIGLILSNYFLGGISTFIGAFFIFLFVQKWNGKKRQERDFAEKISALEKQLEDLFRVGNSTSDQERERLKQIVAMEEEKYDELQTLVRDYQRLIQRQEQFEQEIEKVKNDIQQLENEINEWAYENQLPLNLEINVYEALLKSISEWKNTEEDYLTLKSKVTLIEMEQKELEDELNMIINRLGLKNLEKVAPIQILSQFINKEREKEKRHNSLLEQLELRKEVMLRLESEVFTVEEDLKDLLDNASVKNSEEFRRKGADYLQQKTKLEEKQRCWIQMQTIFSNEAELKLLIDDLEEGYSPPTKKTELVHELQEVEGHLEKSIEQLTKLKQEVDVLEQDGTYEELLLTFSQWKEELQTLAKRWAVYSVSKLIIRQVKSVYEKERQPAVIKRAEQLFHHLTEGSYTRLYAPLGEQRFILERQDGERFEPSQLSRGTCELLYLALRFSLASLNEGKVNFPIFMDETLVNMDKNRRANVITLLKDLSKSRQIIVFTCHQHIVDEYNWDKIYLNREYIG
ncbi:MULTISPECIES: AAA family ATPase [Bacillaceae]|uniref:AAA family ATPase n=1 Tax=Evansella alkalicola TaxID=745819 RepID=A0ABS6JU08_9BACI|nr:MULTISPECIES: AAA family ATPase [Bacillaceae]MBU9720732.1 AAA family ATPase [Bacillus alkalicola]